MAEHLAHPMESAHRDARFDRLSRAAALGARVAAMGMLVASGPALAATPRAGWYHGKVAHAVLGFRVTDGRLRALRTGTIPTTCTDGTRRVTGVSPLAKHWSPRVIRGHFASRVAVRTIGARGTLTLRGRFTGPRRAVGTLRVRLRYGDAAICETRSRRFTAAHGRSEPIPGGAVRIFAGKLTGGTLLEIAMSASGAALKPRRMQAKMSCSDGRSITLDVRNPIDPAVAASATFRGTWRYMPPKITGYADPSGGAIELSGRVTASGVEGAARLSMGFVDGTSCAGGWILFNFPGDTRQALG